MKTLIVTLLGLVAAAMSHAETLSVASLRPNEVIQVTFESSGCFNQSTDQYQITGDTAGRIWFSATAVIREWDKLQKKMVDRGTAPIGKVALTAEEVTGLDSLFRFYRQKHPGGCTLVEKAAVKYERDGVSIGTEEFTDASCMTQRIDDSNLMKQIVTFSKIKKRINPAKE